MNNLLHTLANILGIIFKLWILSFTMLLVISLGTILIIPIIMYSDHYNVWLSPIIAIYVYGGFISAIYLSIISEDL